PTADPIRTVRSSVRVMAWSSKTRSEVDLGTEGEHVFGRPGALVVVEDRAFDVELVEKVTIQVPVQADGPPFGLPVRARRGKTGIERNAIDFDGLVAGGHLERAPAVAPTEVGPWHDTAFRRVFAGEHPRGRNLPGVMADVGAGGAAGDLDLAVNVVGHRTERPAVV